MSRFTEDLRKAAGDQWGRVIHHKFTRELAAGSIDRAVLRRYLIQDHRFLDAFVVLLASTIASARTLEDRIPGCQFIAIITGKENTYFERAFDKLSVTLREREEIPDAACTTRFCRLMRDVAQNGTLGEKLAALVVCEWSYLSWGEIVEKETIRDDFCTYEWVDLHSGPSFQEVVDYLRGLLDMEGTIISTSEKQACEQRFLEAVKLEEEFFEYAYSSE